MHVHANQVNPYAQLDGMYAAQKAAARRAAEQTRKKLMDLASEIGGEAEGEACVVKLGEREEGQAPAEQENQQGGGKRKEEQESGRDASTAENRPADDSASLSMTNLAEGGEGSVSDWV
jgi:hypothetical protein